ncbi:major facilitator superfamily domain-containing protein [Podospora appendiculata]|uniref:Major facilitator superfamily domain-containing protein n=1 Tax=Podospora appendiculata TaxID=314037 RepID=A0AAE1C9V8_9PEZI|nr:major facilitator superfamily domain-containing protein [Podospora appendiculata]
MLDLKRTSSWFRDLIKPSEPSTPNLTNFPRKKSPQFAPASDTPMAGQASQRKDSTIPRSRTRAPTTLDDKFKTTVNNLEHLLNEALVLANGVAEFEDHHCADNVELPEVEPRAASHSRPSVHQSIPSADGSSEDDGPLTVFDNRAPVAAMPDKYIINAYTKRLPKHHRSAPGMHSRNVAVDIPKRTSSLRRPKPPRDRFQEQRLSSHPSSRPLRGEGSSRTPHEYRERDPEPPPSPLLSCLPRVKFARKMRSCGSCGLLRIQHRSSSLHPNTDGPSWEHEYEYDQPRIEYIPEASSKTFGNHTLRSDWGFDGTNNKKGAAEYSLIRGVDGAQETDDHGRNQRPHASPPSALREVMGEFEQEDPVPQTQGSVPISLRGRSHVSLRGQQGFSLSRTYQRQPVARDWSTVRKRFVATVACLSTAMIGVLIGIYAGLVPSIQYWIADLEHYAILGNVFFFLGLAIPTFFFWPLPLLHGRKPYILSSLILAMPLLFPQAIAVSAQRSPYVSTWRWALLSSRAFMGFTLGFASMNFHSILTDLFGASLVSGNPHQEVVDKYDVRRHGGGMGVWLGIWTWCFTGSLGLGFLIGAAIINALNPSWGFYISIVLLAVVLLLNVVCPEARRSPFRRSVAEVRNGNQISRRVARGEVMMHRVKDGPTWWGQEVYHGVLLSLEMLRQPGFIVMSVYVGWIYAQIVLIIVLLGSLTSRYYLVKSPLVGLCVAFISIGALVAVPFQKANIFSRGRHHQQQTNEDTLRGGKITWTSHLLRRAIFLIFLPLVGIAYTFASIGPPVSIAVPTVLAALIGNLSGLAMSECNGLIMETFDTSDLQPGMTGRPRGATNRSSKRTNYSSFPRVTAGFAVCHTIGFVLAAAATGVGGLAQRSLGQREATGVVAGILLVLTVILLAVLIRFKDVQIIPSSKTLEMEKWTQLRRQSIRRRSSEARRAANQNTMSDEDIWRPILIGNPSHRTRRVNVLELGAMTRWTEIRKKNRLIDETAAHLNRAALESAAAAMEQATGIGAMTTDLVRRVSSRRSNRTARRLHSGSPGPSGARAENPSRAATPSIELRRLTEENLDALGAPLPGHFPTSGPGHGFPDGEAVGRDEDLGDLVSSDESLRSQGPGDGGLRPMDTGRAAYEYPRGEGSQGR